MNISKEELTKAFPELTTDLEKSICNYLIRLLDKDILVTTEMVQLAKLVLK